MINARELANSGTMKEKRAWRMNYDCDVLENHGVSIPNVPETQDNMVAIMEALVSSKIETIYGGVMSRSYREDFARPRYEAEKEAFKK